jgi:hypothetical protein
MALHHAPESLALRQAVILLDRPVVGRDGHLGHARLPAIVRLTATVMGAAPVDCSIDLGAVRSVAGVEHPTWSDLQRAWQTLATVLHEKIRAGAFVDGAHDPVVRLAREDVAHVTSDGPGRGRC